MISERENLMHGRETAMQSGKSYRLYTERRAASDNSIIDNAHCIVTLTACNQKFTFNNIYL